jgi:hypothetical protein
MAREGPELGRLRRTVYTDVLDVIGRTYINYQHYSLPNFCSFVNLLICGGALYVRARLAPFS